MFHVNPPHRLTQSALDSALDLASDFFPVTDREIAAQTAIYRAVTTGQLCDVLDAMNRARRHGTRTWRDSESAWARAVDVQIFQDLRSHRREAA